MNLIKPFPKRTLVFTFLQYKSFENTVGKVEIAHNKQFLLFPQYFLPVWMNFLPFSSNLKLTPAKSFSLEQSIIYRFWKGLKRVVVSEQWSLKVPIAPNYKGVCLQNTIKFHSYHLKIWHLL